MRVSPAPAELQALGGPHQEAHGLRRSSPHRQIAVQSRHHGGHDRLAGMASQGVHFVEPGVKVNSAYYCEHMLQQCYWPGILANIATNEQYHFYADNAPSHASASTREFIRLNKPHNEELLAVPASSPDLNVCDY